MTGDVELRLSIERTGSSVHGMVAYPGLPVESFAGWIEMTAAVSRILAAAEESDDEMAVRK